MRFSLLFYVCFLACIGAVWAEESADDTIDSLFEEPAKDIVENQGAPKYGKVTGHVTIFDILYSFDESHALKTEIQHMLASQDSAVHVPDNINGNWAMLLFEYSIAPEFFVSVHDEYNYGNHDSDKKLHYPGLSFGFNAGVTRFSLGYSRQRSGIMCVGGVCRQVPASSGFMLSLTSSF